MLCSLGCLGAANDDDVAKRIWKDPVPFFEGIMVKIPTGDQNLQEEGSLTNDLQAAAYAIAQDIMAADSPDWLHPSALRKAAIQKWGKILEPYTGKLVDLAFGESFANTSAASQSQILLNYTSATPELAGQLRSYLKASPLVAYAAAGLLFEHRLLTEEDRDQLRTLLNSASTQDELLRWASETSVFGMTDGLSVAKLQIESPPPVGEPRAILDHYWAALKVAQNLGTKAGAMQPGLETLVRHPSVAGTGLAEKFEYALDIVTGKQQRQFAMAKNGSGPLDVLAPQVPMTGSRPAPVFAASFPPLAPLPETAPAPGPKPPLLWPWFVAAVLAVGVTFLLVKNRARPAPPCE